ncbi:ASPIC/UnbV domain-containing protein [Akkermansiaceae bacterium]|nr:ASPIC/UnbV domain-containing protein [Akkermansiaceae bacterium]
MRTDSNLDDDEIRKSSKWKEDEINGNQNPSIDSRLEAGDEIIEGKLVVHSLSGKERNHLFMNEEAGKNFRDLSALSGLDSASDSRGLAFLDYDRDGWQDVALVNSNHPLTQLFHNNLGDTLQTKGGMIALRFVGGNTQASPSEFSNRNGFGAMVEVTLDNGTTLKREHRCGEGYGSQNSSTMFVGIGQSRKATSLTIKWPSGKTSTTNDVPEGTLLIAHENNPAEAFTRKPYRVEHKATPPSDLPSYKFPLAENTPGKIQVFTTTATWCTACISHLPSLAYLKTDDIALFGVPVDPNDTPEMLKEYVAQKNPAYQLLTDLSATEKEETSTFLAKSMRTENPVLPSTIITDSKGTVLEVMKGVPTLSHVRKWSTSPE